MEFGLELTFEFGSRPAIANQLPGAHARRVQLEDAVRSQVHDHASVTEPIGYGVRTMAENGVRRPCAITWHLLSL
jgi:hypothetical protein